MSLSWLIVMLYFGVGILGVFLLMRAYPSAIPEDPMNIGLAVVVGPFVLFIMVICGGVLLVLSALGKATIWLSGKVKARDAGEAQ